MLRCFTRVELLDWGNFQESYSDTLRRGNDEEPGTDVLQPSTDDGNKHWEELRKRIVEYVRSLYYMYVCMYVCTSMRTYTHCMYSVCIYACYVCM